MLFFQPIYQPMTDIQITKADPSQAPLLQKIGRTTFYETFAEGNSEENMAQYLEEGFSLEKVRTELENPEASIYFAWLDGQVIGYLKLNFGDSQTEKQNAQAVEIERIYVLKDFLGKKVGQILFEKALEIAKSAKAPYVWLGVWEENPRAIRFYAKNGFVPFDKHIFRLGDDEQTDILMKLTLHP